MITYLNQIIGFTYDTNPNLYILCCMIVIWFMYQFIQLIYNVLGFNK